MKRLTTYRADGRAAIANNENATPKQKVLKIPKVIDRLAAIEDILGDEYDLDRLRELKKADVAAVRHGRWFFKYPNGWACSRCGEWGLMIDNRGICKSSYCPNCGSLMDKEDDK